MKKHYTLITSLLSFVLVLPGCGYHSEPVEDAGDDPITYDEPTLAYLEIPTFRADEEEEESIGPVSKVRIHYVNEDGLCKGRAFYLWCNGVDGVEYSDAVNGADIMTYSADGTSMTIEINIKKGSPDPRFKDFVGLTGLMYIVKYKMISPSNLNWGGQSDDVELKYAEFPPVNEEVDVWCTPAAGGGMAQFATEAETKVDGIKLAQFTDWKTIHCTTTPDTKNVSWQLYAFDENYYRVKLKKREAIKKNYLVMSGQNDVSGDYKEFDIDFPYTAKINCVYCLTSKEVSSTASLNKTCFASYEKLYETKKFEKYYTAKDVMDLGVTYSAAYTTFKVWSPISANISILLYETGNTAQMSGNANDDKYIGWHMNYRNFGVYELTIVGDLAGKYFNYQVDNYNGTTVTTDPYATACGASGVRSMIYDKSKTNPDGWDDLPSVWDGNTSFKWDIENPNEKEGLDIVTPQELSIYEVHIKDFTGDESWVSNKGNRNGTYNAFVESGTRLKNHPEVTTGYDHLNELGISAVQLVPVFDHDNDESPTGMKKDKYNWGYNPLNYNCVEGSYSSDPSVGTTRIKEFKNLVLQMSKTNAHTRVIMDVVYNHVSSPSASNFNKLMPRYYFRYDEKGELYDGSGCHNEVRSDATMMRKFIVESVYMWATEYKIKGFRFDLMGLIDYQTLNAIKDKLSAFDKDIYIYGEGWTSGGYHGPTVDNGSGSTGEVYAYCNNFDSVTGEDNTNKCYVGCFNDTGRNAVRGANSAWGQETVYPQKGFMQKVDDMGDEPAAIADMVWGIHRWKSNYAKQTVNYVSCHDNWTLRDQLYNTINDGSPAHIVQIVRASIASHALVFVSNAAAFMLGGEELLRTKEVSEDILPDCLENTYTKLHGHYISHNSYNSPLKVNSFKWGNKISISLDGNTITNAEYHYVEQFQKLVKLHSEMPKYSLSNNKSGQFPSSLTSVGNAFGNLYWGGSNGGCLGIQFDEYFIYCFSKVEAGQGYIYGDSSIYNYGKKMFSYGSQDIFLDNVICGDQFAIQILYRGWRVN